MTGAWGLENPLTADQGNESKYYNELDRDGILMPTVDCVKRYTDRLFQQFAQEHKRFEMLMAFVGRQLSASYRESITAQYSNVSVQTRKASPANEKAIQETLKLQAETSVDGDVPMTVTVITDRNWTPAS